MRRIETTLAAIDEANCPRKPRVSRLEWMTIAHVAVLVIAGAWMFGGNSEGARVVMSGWGSLALVILFLARRARSRNAPDSRELLRCLWPLIAFNAIVLVSLLNPSFRALEDGARQVYVEAQARLALPSSSRPDLAWRSLWFFDAAYLTSFNLLLVVRSRRVLRHLLLILAGNGLLLAILGTVQKLSGATGLFFGAVKSPQVYFFSSFIYHNHWGAFTILITATALGLLFHFALRRQARDFWHSPAPASLLAVALLAASIPLSGSRSCTVMMALLLTAGLLHALYLIVRRSKKRRATAILPAVAAIVVFGAIAALAYDLGRAMIEKRLANTRDQAAQIRAVGDFGSRAVLYRDTWNMAREKIWFGWGMGSYPTVFFYRNTQREKSPDGLPSHYHDAHSDWLQSASEVGVVGTVLLGLCAAVPLYRRRSGLFASPLSGYLFAGCGLITFYAWLEFPFGNRAVIATWWACLFAGLQLAHLRSPNTPSIAPGADSAPAPQP